VTYFTFEAPKIMVSSQPTSELSSKLMRLHNVSTTCL
jgi:hypothetical protein